MAKVKTFLNGEEYFEELTFEQLSEWSAGRWMAGHGEASDNIMQRADALIRATQPGSAVERLEDTGELIIIDAGDMPAAPVQSTATPKTADELKREQEAALSNKKKPS